MWVVTRESGFLQRLQELANASPGEATVLRLTVEGGGCSGYTYNFTLEGDMRPDDRCALLPTPPWPLTLGEATRWHVSVR